MKKYLPELMMIPFILICILLFIGFVITNPGFLLFIILFVLFVVGGHMLDERKNMVKDFKYHQKKYQLKNNNERN